MKNKVLIFLPLLLSIGLAHSYEVETHQNISEYAVRNVSTLATRLPDFGFAGGLDSMLPDNTHPFHGGGLVTCFHYGSAQKSILELVRLGSLCEDVTGGGGFARYFNHFYDPAHGGAGYAGWYSSLVWGLETADIPPQDYSYKDAQDYFYQALTAQAKADRDANWASTFRTLGNVMHLIQDLGQPQHTRNDSHGAGSRYEIYTNRRDILAVLPFAGYGSVQVTTPDQFWHTADNKGLADYSNRGFVSAGTNFSGTDTNILPATDYPLPDGTGATIEKVQITDLLGAVGPNQPLTGEIHFISTPVRDNYTGVTTTNRRTSTFSLFDDDLSAVGAKMVFSLNRFNFDEAHKLLIPRAVGYSSGMLDYFFRGKLDFVPDAANAGKCAIKNLGDEDMNGTFTLYYDDSTGVRKPVPGASWSVSIPAGQQVGNRSVTLPTPAPTQAQPYTLVFNGTMGQEHPIGSSKGAIAVVRPVINKDNMVVQILSDNTTTDPYTGYTYETWNYALKNSAGTTISTWTGYMEYFPDTNTRIYTNWFCGSMNYSTGVTYGCDLYATFSGASSIIPDVNHPSDLTPAILLSNSSYPVIINAVGGDLIEVSRPPGYVEYQAKPCK